MPSRLIALGASNLTRALYTVTSIARASWSRDIEIVAALGLGRSYGQDAGFLGRTSPGILSCGLWRQMDAMPPADTVGLIADVGNDILYNHPPAVILDWIDEAARRLERHASTIVIAGLPVAGERRISEAQFRYVRHLLVPSCRLTFAEAMAHARTVDDGLQAIARRRGHRFVPLDAAWYGFDPIHIRMRYWRAAWTRVLLNGDAPAHTAPRRSFTEAARLHLRLSAEQRFFGVPIRRVQTGARLPHGGRLWLY